MASDRTLKVCYDRTLANLQRASGGGNAREGESEIGGRSKDGQTGEQTNRGHHERFLDSRLGMAQVEMSARLLSSSRIGLIVVGS